VGENRLWIDDSDRLTAKEIKKMFNPVKDFHFLRPDSVSAYTKSIKNESFLLKFISFLIKSPESSR
jgi:hypothetical protein